MNDYQDRLDRLLAEERELRFPAFDEETAWNLGCRFRTRGQEGRKPIAIEIAKNGQQLFLCALPGATADNSAWIRRKSAVVNRFQHSSLYMRILCESRGVDFNAKHLLDEREYAAHGGSFPLLVRDCGCVGSITVSGLPQIEDHEFVIAVLREFLGLAPRP